MLVLSFFKKSFLPYLFLILGFCFFISESAVCEEFGDDFFKVRAKIKLCPEYSFENINLDIYFHLTNDPVVYKVEVLESNIDPSKNEGEFLLKIPATYGKKDLHLVAFCSSDKRPLSNPSNEKILNNCERLKLIDSDNDGINNFLEDRDCSNWFSPGDLSNPHNVDTDGDGARDLVEIMAGFDPLNPGSSPRPYILSGAPFDPDGDGDSNSVVFRPSEGFWYVRNFVMEENHLRIPFGKEGDIPFVYNPEDGTSDLGFIRKNEETNSLIWHFRGLGFKKTDGTRIHKLVFGSFGDNNIILGPWETPKITNPAIATMYYNVWSFYIYKRDGTLKHYYWGREGDLPRVQDYDGDGIFDVAVFRPSEGKTYVIKSTDGLGYIYNFGHGSYDHSFRGDVTGDGIDDITFWEPLTGNFYSMISDNGFNDEEAKLLNPLYYQMLHLGKYYTHVPLSWNKRGSKIRYTIIDHQRGLRHYKEGPQTKTIQWGLPGDAQG